MGTPRASRAPRVAAAGLTAAAVAVCATACGSGTKPAATSSPYDLAATKACLGKESGVVAYRNAGNKAIGGSKGELRVTFGYGRPWIYMAFGRNDAEAVSIENRAVALTLRHENAHGKVLDRKTVVAGVRVRRNVFYYADGGPVGEVEGGQVARCLRVSAA
jgi:hypothetical protein